jgi:phosphopantetheinyl transferase
LIAATVGGGERGGGTAARDAARARASAHSARESAWPRATEFPSLASAAIHVWKIDLRTCTPPLAALSGAESARAERFLNPEKGRLWASSRAVLRELLGRYAGVQPGLLEFASLRSGKPVLRYPRDSDLQFSISHSRHLALVSIARALHVGVDVELPRRVRSERALMSRLGRNGYGQRDSTSQPTVRRDEFLRLWTRREAVLKLHGSLVEASPKLYSSGRKPCVRELDLGIAGAAALATDQEPVEIRCCGWVALPNRT